jgi:hypothetical protein
MCGKKTCCRKPERLREKPEKCTQERIQECHGDVKKHPCANKPKGK